MGVLPLKIARHLNGTLIISTAPSTVASIRQRKSHCKSHFAHLSVVCTVYINIRFYVNHLSKYEHALMGSRKDLLPWMSESVHLLAEVRERLDCYRSVSCVCKPTLNRSDEINGKSIVDLVFIFI